MDNSQNDKFEVLSGILDKESKTYSFEKELSVEGKKLKGTFTAKYMGIGARLKMGSIRAKLLDGAPQESVDRITDDIAYMIAYLSVTLIKTPSWFNYETLDEYKDLESVYMEVYNFMQSFRRQNEENSNAGNSKTPNRKAIMENQ